MRRRRCQVACEAMSEARPDAASAKTLTTTIAGALRRPWPLATMLLAACAVPPAPDASEHDAAAPSLHEIRVGVQFVAPDARSDEDRRTGDERKPPALPRPPEGPEHHAGDEPRQVE